MSEVRREVWVVEREDGFPLAAYIGKQAETLARTWQDDRAFRYVPEQSALSSAQGEGTVTLTREQLRDNAAAAWDAGYMAHREGKQRHNPYGASLPPPRKPEGSNG